jgi:hypothetical protein
LEGEIEYIERGLNMLNLFLEHEIAIIHKDKKKNYKVTFLTYQMLKLEKKKAKSMRPIYNLT